MLLFSSYIVLLTMRHREKLNFFYLFTLYLELIHLEKLNLSNTSINDDLIPALNSSIALVMLNLSHTTTSDSGITKLELPKLSTLIADDTEVSSEATRKLLRSKNFFFVKYSVKPNTHSCLGGRHNVKCNKFRLKMRYQVWVILPNIACPPIFCPVDIGQWEVLKFCYNFLYSEAVKPNQLIFTEWEKFTYLENFATFWWRVTPKNFIKPFPIIT